MFFSQDVISEVKALNDIVDVVAGYVKLSPRSGNHFGICPFHNEKTPSFSVNGEKQIFYCFGCGAGGNVISFIKRIENVDFPDALKLLAERVRYNLPQKSIDSRQEKIKSEARETATRLNKLAARFYYENLHTEESDAKNAKKYLEDRGVTLALMRRFGLGLSPDAWDGLLKRFPDIPQGDFEIAGLVKKSEKQDNRFYDRFRNRLMFPIIDHRERVIGFGGRVMGDSEKEAKYINSPGTAVFQKSECLYGLNLAKKARSSKIIIVEGYMDVMTMHSHGFINTVGVLGTALTAAHVRLLKNAGANSVILILDSDAAGTRAALRAIPILTKAGLLVNILELPGAKDPDEFLNRFGAEKFKNILNASQSHIRFQVELARKKHNLDSTQGRINFTQESAKILATLTGAIEMDAYVSEISKETEISREAISREIEKITGESRMFGELSDYSPSPRTRIIRKHGEDLGLKNAKKELISLLFSEPSAAKALQKSECLTPEIMNLGETNDIFGKLLNLSAQNLMDKPLSASDIMDLFESDNELHIIAEIFAQSREFPSEAAVEKVLNDTAKKIKTNWLHSRMAIEKNDLNAVKTLQIQLKTLNSLNITLHDG